MREKVLLISMPFGPLTSPSIGLTLLNQNLLRNNIDSEIIYLNLAFAKKTGLTLYSKISSGFPVNHDMVGEWIFSGSAFNPTKDDSHFISEIVQGNNKSHAKSGLLKAKISDKFISDILRLKESSKSFIEECVDTVLKMEPAIIGFTSVFQQQFGSLALAKATKEKNKDIKVCFGGANNEGLMGVETIKNFDYVDYVVSGEGEEAFLHLVQEILKGNDCNDYKGIISKHNYKEYALQPKINTRQITNLNTLPNLNYDDYFQQLTQLGLKNKFMARLPFETSRGCWWGMKNHCTFCGLNGENMTQRTKSAKRALEEFIALLNKYPGHPVSVVDNILDYNYFKDFIPSLAELRESFEYELFYEVKANLTKDQLTLLKQAGITIIQPGIESFCKGTLKIMSKGVSPLQNIQLLKWCKELGVEVEWNILYGFPHENIEEYQEITHLLPLLTHLDPPGSTGQIRLDRFSPNFNDYDKLGFKDIKPYPTYDYLYPFENASVFNLAYYFTYSYKEKNFELSELKPFLKQVKHWKNVHNSSALFYSDNGEHLIIWDLRPVAKSPIFVLTPRARYIYLLCDKGQRIGQCIQTALENEEGLEFNDQEVQSILNFFIHNKLMIRIDDHYLSLAVNDMTFKRTKTVVNKISKLIISEKSGIETTYVLDKALVV